MHDLGGRVWQDHDLDDELAEVTLSEEEYRLLESIDPSDVLAEQLIRGAIYEPDAIRLAGTRDEFDALNEELSNAIRTARRPRRERVRRLRHALQL